jgi:hypothetical protein
MAMNRRQFLRVSGTSAVAASLTSGARGASADAAFDLRALAQPDLLSILGPEAVRAIGVRYRELVPAENQLQALHAAILAARPWSSRVPWLPGPRVVELVEEDFAAGRTIFVQGWVLSATEARQTALFSFLPS